MALDLTTPLASVPGIGPRSAEKLAYLGLTNVGRLLAHLPMRHEFLEAETPIAQLKPDGLVSARGQVTACRAVLKRPRPRFEAVLHDGTARLDLVWFNALYLREKIRVGDRLRVQGKARAGPGGKASGTLQLANPTFEVLGEDDPALRDARWRPVYPAGGDVYSKLIEHCVRAILPEAVGLIEDHLPPEYRAARELPPLAEAYRMIHDPRSEHDAQSARRRLAFDELLLLQLAVHMKRQHLRGTLAAPALEWSDSLDRTIRGRFPFALTPAQNAVVREIVADLTRPIPANRLIQGDVGSGKTILALYAMMLAAQSGKQAALMAPTELLAEQHARNITRILAGTGIAPALLTGSTPAPEREALLARLAAGEPTIVVGTHAILTERVKFASLAVAVIDEQHRFGVSQRATLREKGQSGELAPHVLVMTATPIPRTLAISLFGDLDISTVRGLPPGRTPVRTRLVGPAQRPDVYAYLRTRVEAGEQAYVVAPAIDESDAQMELADADEGTPQPAAQSAAHPATGEGKKDLASVRGLMKELEEGPLAGLKLAAIHGRLKPAARDEIMERFRAGMIDVLVATTVIEVGVDVPNSTLMVIENAERFGMAQLHQLRGRVGRGSKASACVLIASKDPETLDETSIARLKGVASTNDGFALAEKDLALRGIGDLFGTRQSGLPPFRVADLAKDTELLLLARSDAAAWIARSPTLARFEESLLKRRLLKQYGATFGLGDVG
ncbi:MAG: ATP-dependent DNA helicase RecG [Planctomycetota bacterium]|nr:ATP-dependent DNA helicase RecG [Planctomycetota bacterium]